MSSQWSNGYKNFQDFLDQMVYTKTTVKTYEWMFGSGYLSTGGLETTKQIIPLLELKKGQRVLDVGCGLGGHDFYMAENYGVFIDGIDLSQNMISVANQHLATKKPLMASKVNFRIGDVTTTQFPDNYYDVIYSRDVFFFIKTKSQLFQSFYRWLKPGGRIVFTDYCRVETDTFSDDFENFMKQKDYDFVKQSEYEIMIKNNGFENIMAVDIKDMFVSSLHRELNRLYKKRQKFLEAFSAEDFDDMEQWWLTKTKNVQDNHQTWALFKAFKPI